MKNERVFEAIGQLDEAMIAQTEEVKARPKKFIGRAVLVAAVIMGLSVTAVAAPAIRNALLGAKVEKDDKSWYTPTNSAGNSYEQHLYEITLEVDMDEDAPETIEAFYLPEIGENLVQMYGYHNEMGHVQYGWKSELDYLYFTQLAGGKYDPDTNKEFVYAVPGDVPKAQMQEYAGVQCYLIEEKPVGEYDGMKTVIWSDGRYLFRLEVSYGYTDARIEELVASVKAVEDVTPHLMPVTE